ncbi:MAG: hypothetical protein JXM72_07570 [Deltaproteobacteria bacterium]|nr:hypothetical protein [Deltaproteobacteria bacterium]
MNLTCHKCGFTAGYLEFAYLCKNGCPACGESELRQCPACGTRCVFSRAESLEDEQARMKELSMNLAAITRADGPDLIQEARHLVSMLHDMNMRWNSDALNTFLLAKQKELFF